MKDRRFGVEVECGFRGKASGYDAATHHWREAVELLASEANAGRISNHWADYAGHDGSLVEFRSPILQGKAGFKELHHVMNTLRENGGYVTASDGLHIHHDAPDFADDVNAVIRAVDSWVSNERLIHEFVAPRRRNGWASPSWRAGSVETVKNLKDRNTKGDFKNSRDFSFNRCDFNIAALNRHGSIEIRLLEGTLDPVRAEAWIRFGQAFLNKIISMKSKPVVIEYPTIAEGREILLKRIRAPKYTIDNLPQWGRGSQIAA